MLPSLRYSALVLACAVISAACASGDATDAPPANAEFWDITVTFEESSAVNRRTDEFALSGAAWDGDENILPARWTVCIEGAQDGCSTAHAECAFSGDAESDMRNFEIRCDDDSDGHAVDTPCATIESVEFCAIIGTVTTDQSQCDDDDYARWDDPVFCTDAFDATASTLTGGVGREFGPSSYGVTWRLDKREDPEP